MGSSQQPKFLTLGSRTKKIMLLGAFGLVPASLVSLIAYGLPAPKATTTAHITEVSESTDSTFLVGSSAETLNTEQLNPTAEPTTDSGVSVRINGEQLPIPSSGNLNTTVPTDDGSTVHVEVRDSTSSQAAPDENESSVNVNIRTDASSEGSDDDTNIDTRTRIRIRQD